MQLDNDAPELRSAHVIVVGNEKGGAGKSTISIHLTVALLEGGLQGRLHRSRHAPADADAVLRKSPFLVAATRDWPIELPLHCAMRARRNATTSAPTRRWSSRMFADAIGAVEHEYEFVVIDTPASDSYLMRLAHSLADTLVSPLNDSYVDIDVFSRVQHDRTQRGAVSQYADLVMQARRKRRLVDNGVIDWVMVRNRIASIASNNARQIAVSIARLSHGIAISASRMVCMTASSSANCSRSASPRSTRSRKAPTAAP